MPKYTDLVHRTKNEGSEAWNILFQAWKDRDAGEDVIILAVGDPDLETPEKVKQAAKDALDNGDTHYIDIPGLPALREAISEELMQVSGASADAYAINGKNVMVTQGTQNALFLASLCLLQAGDEVIALEPMYLTYEASFEVNDAKIIRVPSPRETDFRPRADLIEQAVTSKTKAILFANPNNPTGAVFTRPELQAIADIAIKHDLWVIADEVYASQIFKGEHLSIAALPGMAERTVTCGSLSKSMAMTGWRIGWVAGPVEFIDHCHNVGIAMHYGVSNFIQKAAITAMKDCADEVVEMREIYRRRKDLVLEGLANTPGIVPIEPQGAMYVLVDVTATGFSSGDYAKALYNAERVAVLDAKPFGTSADGCIRIAFTISDEDLSRACERIRKFTISLQSQ